MIFKFVLKGFKLKKIGCWAKKWLNQFNLSTGCARPVKDRLREAKKFLSLPVAFSSWSRSGYAQRSPAKHLMLMASQPVDPYLDRTNPQMASLVFLFYKKAPNFIVSQA